MSDRRAQLLVALWAVAAIAFSLWRVPYDDEWFSLTLARDTTPAQFWDSLGRDVHPPYVALLDRLLVAGTGALWSIHVAHTLASVAAIALCASAAARLGAPAWAFALGALHPIVFMYAGAARWYPLAFLADALRFWALAATWSGASRRRTEAAMFAGCVLGPLSGYAEVVRVAVDAVVWVGLAARTGRGRRAAGIATAGAIVAAAALVTPPTFRAQLGLGLEAPGARESAGAVLTLLGLGPLGEAHPPPPWTLALLVAPAGLVVAGWRAIREPRTRRAALLVGTQLGAWTLCAPLGVWHPRYALIAWLGVTGLLADAVWTAWSLRRRRTWADVALLATAAYLALGLALTVDGRWFLKRDLRVLGAEACGPVFSPPADLVVVPYPRARDLLVRACAPASRPAAAGWIRHYRQGDPALLAELAAALPSARTVTLVTVPTGGSTLEETQRQSRALLETRCHSAGEARAVGEDPFGTAKAWLGAPSAGEPRLWVTRLECDAP